MINQLLLILFPQSSLSMMQHEYLSYCCHKKQCLSTSETDLDKSVVTFAKMQG